MDISVSTRLLRTSLLTAVMVFLLALCSSTCSFAAESGSFSNESGTFGYSISGQEDDLYVTITSYERSSVPEDGSVCIPDSIEGYPVRVIGSNAFKAVSNMKNVTIPGSVETISAKAFYLSEDIVSVSMEEGLKVIGDKAFYQAVHLDSLIFPDSLESIGAEAFAGCTWLRDVSVGKGTSSIGADAFSNCLKLECFNVDPQNAWYASAGGVLLSSDGKILIKYPPLLTVDGQKTEEYIMPEGVEEISDGAFMYVTGLKSLKFAGSVRSIGNQAFAYCQDLAAVTLPAAAESIGEGAFEGCSKITTINIPAELSVLPMSAFAGCSGISEYNVEDGNKYYSSDEGVLYDAGYKTLLKYPAMKTDREYTIPEGVISISDYGFEKAFKLERVILPDGIRSIGGYAFSGCSRLSEIMLPDTLESIGEYAFLSCMALKTLTLPDNLKTIGAFAFYSSGITEIEVPGTVEKIEPGMMLFCNSLERVVLNMGTKEIGDRAFSTCSNLKELTIPETVIKIKSSILDYSGTTLAEGESIRIIGYIDSAGETFYEENAERCNLTFERAVTPENQTIKVTKTRNCIYGSKPFAVGATAKTPLTYTSSNAKVASISSKGVVTLKGVGTAVITIDARETNYFKAAKTKVTIKVKPGKPSLKAKNRKRRKVKIVWGKVAGADGYEVYIKSPGQKKFHKRATRSARVKSITHSRLRKGRYYSYKVRAFTKVNGKKVYGSFSKVRRVKIKR